MSESSNVSFWSLAKVVTVLNELKDKTASVATTTIESASKSLDEYKANATEWVGTASEEIKQRSSVIAENASKSIEDIKQKSSEITESASKSLDEYKANATEWMGTATEQLGEATKNITQKSTEVLDTAKVWALEKTEEGKALFSTAIGVDEANLRFGVPLEVACSRDNENIPVVVTRCLDFLENPAAIKTPNLFKEEVDQSVIKTLISVFNSDKGKDFSLEMYTPHIIASLLMSYLRSLPATIIESDTEHLTTLGPNSSKLSMLRNIIMNRALVHENNYLLLQRLSTFFSKLLEHKSENGITVHDLVGLFGPVIVKDFANSQSGEFIMRTIVEAHEEVFEVSDVDINEIQGISEMNSQT